MRFSVRFMTSSLSNLRCKSASVENKKISVRKCHTTSLTAPLLVGDLPLATTGVSDDIGRGLGVPEEAAARLGALRGGVIRCWQVTKASGIPLFAFVV